MQHAQQHGPGPTADRRAAVLDQVCRRALDVLALEGAAVVQTSPPDSWDLAHATDPRAALMAEASFVAGEGPAAAALASHRPVLVTDVTDPTLATRWPGWTAAAVDGRGGAVFVLPLELGPVSLGVVILTAADPCCLTPAGRVVVSGLTDAVLVALLDIMVGREPGAADGHGADADLYAAEIYQASGMVMGQTEGDAVQSLVRLRAHAFATGRRVGDVARDVLARRLRFSVDGGHVVRAPDAGDPEDGRKGSQVR